MKVTGGQQTGDAINRTRRRNSRATVVRPRAIRPPAPGDAVKPMYKSEHANHAFI